MVSPWFMLTSLEKLGLLNLNRFETERIFGLKLSLIQTVHTFVCTRVLLLFVICESVSVVSQAIHYFPEFVQTLLDNTTMWVLLFIVYYFQSKYREFTALAKFMDNSFSKADAVIVQRCNRRTNVVTMAIVIVVFFGFSGSFLETLLPISEKEMLIQRKVYGVQNITDRRLPYKIKVPFIDETQTPYFEVFLGMQLYGLFLCSLLAGLSISIVPVTMVLIRSQYRMMSKFILMIGDDHRDELGYRIYYTDIEKNQYEINYTPIIRGDKQMRIQNALKEIRKQKKYEQNYLRQIVRFHQKLLTFQNEVTKMFSPVVLVLVMANYIFYVLCLYILVVSTDQVSPQRYFKFILEFLAFLLEFYLICNSSEVTDNCSGMICKAVNGCNWIRCTKQTRRDLRMILRRVQVPNHLRFHNGAIVLNRVFFLRVFNVVYNFVNFMRAKSMQT